MRISSATINLFSIVAIAIVGAWVASYALQNPSQMDALVRNVAERTQIGAPVSSEPLSVAQTENTDAEVKSSSSGDVTLKADDNGHFAVEAEINGRSVDVMVDTGATLVALTYEDAERSGIFLRPSDFTHFVSTANGRAKVAPIMIERLSIGPITVRNIQGAVSERGKMRQTLLGMSFLGRLSRVDMRAGTLVLHE